MPSGAEHPGDSAAPGPTRTSTAHAEALSSKVPWDAEDGRWAAGGGRRETGPAVASVPSSLTGPFSAPAAGFPCVLQICYDGGTDLSTANNSDTETEVLMTFFLYAFAPLSSRNPSHM